MPDPILHDDPPADLADLERSVRAINLDATIRMMGWASQRIGQTSRIRLDYEDSCGVCGAPCREYDVAVGLPICSEWCRRKVQP